MTTIKFDIIEPYDIQLFSADSATDRASNSNNNELRENILLNISDMSDDYFSHPEYGPLWSNLKEKLDTALTPLCCEPFTRFALKKMAGMANNYDFIVRYFNNSTVVSEVKVEFKFNNNSVRELTQFLELYDRDCKAKFDMTSYSYSEYYYDHWLDQYLELDMKLMEEKPTKEVYVKKISDIKYSHPFFRNLYDRKNEFAKEKRLLVKQSIKAYLELYAPHFNFEMIKDKIISSQTNKVFLMWDCSVSAFQVETIDLGNIELHLIENSITDLCFDLEVTNYTHNIRVRLNWGNNNGIANPRWKFTFINK
jgi:hypothetical protein